MRIIRKDIKSKGARLKIDSMDDLWYLSRIIEEGDEVSGLTTRKISVNEKEGERKKVFIKISVEKVEFREFSERLKILGKIVESSDSRVPLGDHHSFNIGVGDEVSIRKKMWSKIFEVYLDRAAKTKQPSIMLISCDYGDALFAFYHSYGIEYAGELSEYVGGKRELKEYEKNKAAFVSLLLSKANEIAKMRNVKVIAIGGAGTIARQIEANANKHDYMRGRTFVFKISYSGRSGIREIISKKEFDRLVADSIQSQNIRLMQKVLELIGRGGNVAYGLNEVKRSVDEGAVHTLLLTDSFVRQNRKIADELISKSDSLRAKISIIPSSTDAGVQLDNLGGVASLLRFKL